MTLRKRSLPLPKTGRGEMTRRKILDAAKREIGRRGFAEASISTITAEAGVAQGTFYIYFRTKEDVMRELVLHMGRMLRHHLTEATAGAKNRLEAEKLGLRAFLDFVRKNPDLYKVVEESQFVDPAIYRQRNQVERFFCKLKHFRRIATRFDKLARNFLAAVLLASTRLWLRAYESTT